MINFVTLFDYNYIERGLALISSLHRVCTDYILYIIAFDENCYVQLTRMQLNSIIVIRYSDFENDILRVAKSNRSKRAYLWTCSSFGIKYVMDRFRLENCTYIDSDLYFYSNPAPIIEKFLLSNDDVAIISHRYSKHIENDYFEKKCGKYCVEFNTFKNTNNSRNILEWWCEKCFEYCPEKPTKGAFGDQKYLDYFSKEFKGVHVYLDFGIGVAPWNVDDYCMISNNKILNKKTREEGELVFYHFHAIDFTLERTDINVYKRPGKKDDRLIKSLYCGYLLELKNSLFLIQKTQKDRSRSDKQNVIQRTWLYLFEEKNCIIAFRKLIRLLLYRKKDIFSIQ